MDAEGYVYQDKDMDFFFFYTSYLPFIERYVRIVMQEMFGISSGVFPEASLGQLLSIGVIYTGDAGDMFPSLLESIFKNVLKIN